MWIPKKKWLSLEKRVAVLEVQVRSQQKVAVDMNAIKRQLQKKVAIHDNDEARQG